MVSGMTFDWWSVWTILVLFSCGWLLLVVMWFTLTGYLLRPLRGFYKTGRWLLREWGVIREKARERRQCKKLRAFETRKQPWPPSRGLHKNQ